MNPLLKSLLQFILKVPFLRALSVMVTSRLTHRRRGSSELLAQAWTYPRYKTIPWVHNQIPMNQSTVAMITTSGLFVKGQAPFEEKRFWGDYGYRPIHRTISLSKLAYSQYAADTRLARLDPNMLLPIQRLQALADEGFIKAQAVHHYSFYGYCLDLKRLIYGSAKDVARRLRYEGVDKALIMTSSVLSQNTAIIVQRSIEAEGIPTCSIVYTSEALKGLRPPRSVQFKNGSLYRQEEYLEPQFQTNLLKVMLGTFGQFDEPGKSERMTLGLLSDHKPIEARFSAPKIATFQRDLFQ
jgi:hypothetical protein